MNHRLVALLLSAFATLSDAAPWRGVPEKIDIEDADTLLVEIGGASYRVQLPDVDAPENSVNPKLQRDLARTGLDTATLLALGRRADRGLQAVLDAGPSFELQFDPEVRDKYGRTPGDLVSPNGKALSLLLVERGYAVPLPTRDPARRKALNAALAEARSGRRGLWGSDGRSFAAWADQGAGPTSK